jgi:hypothetical protein
MNGPMAKTPTVHVNLRLPPDLHRALVEEAAAQDPPMSLNSGIVNMLRGALSKQHDVMKSLRNEWQGLPQREKDERAFRMLRAFLQSLEKSDEPVAKKKKDVA